MEQQRPDAGCALVTGASSGLGAAFAEQLARRRYNLVLVARRRERLDVIAGQLREAYEVDIETIAADLTRPDDLETVARRLEAPPDLTLLVNNAGRTVRKSLLDITAEELLGIVALKVTALTRLTHAALRGMVARGTGAIINVSSVSALNTSPPAAAYCASNNYVLTFTEAVAKGVAGSGVRLQALCPGFIQSEFFEQAGWDVLGSRPRSSCRPTRSSRHRLPASSWARSCACRRWRMRVCSGGSASSRRACSMAATARRSRDVTL